MPFIVAIDGPAGTGKSSVAKALAKELNFIYVDTGAIYRALAYVVQLSKINAEEEEEVLKLVPRLSIVIDEHHLESSVMLDKQILSKELRSEEISRLSSVVSKHQKVREALLLPQRNLLEHIKDGAIFEGRDIGTVVFPKAHLKIFITASAKTRAQRRHQELLSAGQDASFDDVYQAIKNRDERDEKRSSAPMQKASDAYEIDSSDMSKMAVIEQAKKLIEQMRTLKNVSKGQALW